MLAVSSPLYHSTTTREIPLPSTVADVCARTHYQYPSFLSPTMLPHVLRLRPATHTPETGIETDTLARC